MENLEQKVKEHEEVLLKYPKNIRQIGEISDNERIYVEDYVITYITHLASEAKDGFGSAVLLGKKAVVEGRRTIFISGAAELSQQWKQTQGFAISGEQWTDIYDQMQKYFHDIEILGWFLTCPGMELKVNEQIRTVWHSSFEGSGKVLLLYDSVSREDAFYTNRAGEFLRQPGYYIYYEKNEEMQNYIIDAKGGKSSDDGYQDITSGKIRKKIQEKNKEHRRYLFQQQLLYSMGILAGAVILVTAGTRLYQGVSGEVVAEQVENVQQVSGQSPEVIPDKEADAETKIENKEKEQWMISEEKETETENEKMENGQKEQEKEQTKNVEYEGKTGQGEKGEVQKETGKGTKEDVLIKSETKTGNEKNKTAEKEIYKVKKGDTLESISIKCYGTSRYIKRIKRLNKLEDVDKIYIGQKLVLP